MNSKRTQINKREFIKKERNDEIKMIKDIDDSFDMEKD